MKPLVGQAFSRLDGPAKVTGKALYTADHRPEGCLHGWLVGAEIAHGRIRTLDCAGAERAPGVQLVLTHLNRGPLNSVPAALSPLLLDNKRPPLADDRVLHHGQYLALVVAETLEQARHAAALIRVEYASEKPLLAREEAPPFRPGSSLGIKLDYRRGSTEHGLSVADVCIEATYRTPIEHPCALEAHATVASWQGEHLLVHDSTQWVMASHTVLASTFHGTMVKLRVIAGLGRGLLGFGATRGPRDKVRVQAPFIGGMFGSKSLVGGHVLLTALAARRLSRPVKTCLSRPQVLTQVGQRPQTEQTITLGATREGLLTAIRHQAWSNTSPEDDVVEGVNHTTRLLYACPNYQTSHELSRFHVVKPSWMRAPGETPGLFALESAMDELACALELDPVELRRRNHAEKDPTSGKPFSAKHLLQCYSRGAYQFGWADRDPRPGSMREGAELIGWGMATASHPAISLGAVVRLRLVHEEGQLLARVSTAGVDVGTGMLTIMAMGVADGLGVPVEQVRVDLGDSYSSYCSVAGGSNLTASVMPAITAACARMRKQLCSRARLRERDFFTQDWQRWTGLVPEIGLEVEGRSGPKLGGKYAFRSFGAHFVEVRLLPELGRVRLSRIVSVFDVGRVINERTARSQLVGGIVFGIGQALLEELRFDPRQGRAVNADLAGYLIPVHADIPEIEVSWINEPDLNFNPLGARGLGEVGITGVAAAIANAVYHASGRRVRDLPIGVRSLL